MRPIPAPRLGDTHGLLRAINQRERLRLDEFITEFSIEELFPPGLENALGRTRQFVSFARSAGLLNEDRGSVELTEIGKRYVRAGDDEAIFDVASDQAEWLRRQLRERHMTDSIYHGAAIGLSLYSSCPPDFRVSMLDFGRALAYLGRAGWDNENTLESQGERYTTFLRDLELVDEEARLTATGTEAKGELTLPVHMSLRDLAGQLNPGGPEAAESEGEAEWAARSAAAEEPATEAQPAAADERRPRRPWPRRRTTGPGGDRRVRGGPRRRDRALGVPDRARVPGRTRETAPAADTAAAADSAAAGETAPAEPPPAPEPGRPVPPSDIWETAAPDETTRAYAAIEPEQAAAAAAAADAAADEPDAPVAGEPSAAETEAPASAAMTSGDPLAGPAAEVPEAEAEPVAAEPEGGDPLAEPAAAEPELEAAPPEPEPGDPLEAGMASGDPLAAPAEAEAGATEEPAMPAGEPPVEGPPAAVEAGDPLAAGAAAPEAGDLPTPEPVTADADAPEAAVSDADVPAPDGEVLAPEPEPAPLEQEPEPEPAAADPAAAPEPAAADPAAAPDLAAAEPVGVDGPGVESAAPEVTADAEVADAAPVVTASTREPSGFLDLAAVRAAAEESGLKLPDAVYAGLVAALASGKHLVISGPAGSGKSTLALAIAKAAVQAGRSAGAALATASPKWGAHDTVGRVGEGGFSQGIVLAAAGKKKWLLIDEIDRAKFDKAFGDLSSFLGGLPLSLPDGSREVAAPSDWRIVATRDVESGPIEASSALLRRFAQVHLPRPEQADLEAAIDAAADGDPTAAAAVRRLLALDLPGLGAGTFLDAARHGAERNALASVSEDELARELLAAYIAPHLHAEPGRVKELEDSL